MTRLNDPSGSRPFDASRDGFVLAEGAAVLPLKPASRARSRGACVHAEVRGVGNTADAWDITAPCYSGEGAIRAMKAALDDAGAQPDDIGLVSAHGASTRLHDLTEAKAIRAVFGDGEKPDVMALKALTGHAMGASGAIKAATVCMVFNEGSVPPNPHL